MPNQLGAIRASAAGLGNRLLAELVAERQEQEQREAFLRVIANRVRQRQRAAERLRSQYRAPCDRTPPRPAGRAAAAG